MSSNRRYNGYISIQIFLIGEREALYNSRYSKLTHVICTKKNSKRAFPSHELCCVHVGTQVILQFCIRHLEHNLTWHKHVSLASSASKILWFVFRISKYVPATRRNNASTPSCCSEEDSNITFSPSSSISHWSVPLLPIFSMELSSSIYL